MKDSKWRKIFFLRYIVLATPTVSWCRNLGLYWPEDWAFTALDPKELYREAGSFVPEFCPLLGTRLCPLPLSSPPCPLPILASQPL